MARYDKYGPKTGGFRAVLAADWLPADLGKVVAVSLDTDGHVVKGTAGNSGFVGVLILTKKRYAGDVVDVMTAGDIVDFDVLDDGTSVTVTAGTVYYAAASGAVNTTKTGNRVGVTVEKSRLVVRAQAQLVAS